MKPVVLEGINVAAWVFMILGNTASVLGLLGNTNAKVAHDYPTAVMPADYAFSIWSYIFAATGFHAIYHLYQAWKGRSPAYRASFAPLFIVNMIGNGLWSAFFALEAFWTCLGIMVVLLVTLFLMLRILYSYENGRTPHVAAAKSAAPYYRSFLVARAANWLWIGPYFGWMSVAVLLNLAIVVKYSLGWFGAVPSGHPSTPPVLHGEVLFAQIAFAAAVGAAIAVASGFLEWGYAAAVAWALFAVTQRCVAMGGAKAGSVYAPVKSAAGMGYIAAGLVALLTMVLSVTLLSRGWMKPSGSVHRKMARS